MEETIDLREYFGIIKKDYDYNYYYQENSGSRGIEIKRKNR